jgi:hypothetical protein
MVSPAGDGVDARKLTEPAPQMASTAETRAVDGRTRICALTSTRTRIRVGSVSCK